MSVCVLDADTPLGAELYRQLGATALPVARSAVDPCDTEQLFRMLLRLQPTAVINAIDYADHQLAELEPDRCFAINAIAVRRIAEACELLRCPLVQLSTDRVFDEDSPRQEPYRETDPTCPGSVFGHSKRTGESYVAACPRHFIVRTSALYGHARTQAGESNFVESLLQLGRAGTPLALVNDLHFAPSYITHVAGAILHLFQDTEAYGIYHIANSGSTSWFGFARELFHHVQPGIDLRPIASADDTSARWPKFSMLDTSKFGSLSGHEMPSWQAGLVAYLAAEGLIPNCHRGMASSSAP
jgi:dTDP-4-dehydrorhamnose reductase